MIFVYLVAYLGSQSFVANNPVHFKLYNLITLAINFILVVPYLVNYAIFYTLEENFLFIVIVKPAAEYEAQGVLRKIY